MTPPRPYPLVEPGTYSGPPHPMLAVAIGALIGLAIGLIALAVLG